MSIILAANISLHYKNLTNTNTTTRLTSKVCSLNGEDGVILIGYFFVFLMGTVGNGLVIYFYRKKFRNGPVIEVLILYLAIFDFISSILDPALFGYWIMTCQLIWDFGEIGCKILPPLSRITTNVSIGIVLIMAIDRCRMIVSPFSGHLKLSTIHRCAFIIVLLGGCSEINYMYGLYITEAGTCSIRDLRYYHGYSIPLIALVTLRVLAIVIILACTTTAASYKLNVIRKSTMMLDSSQQTNKHLTVRFYKVTRMLVVMAILFTVTVIPRDILHLVYTITWITPGSGIKGQSLKRMNQALKLLQTSNAIYNVFIYAGMYKPFRKLAKSTFTCYPKFLALPWRNRGLRLRITKNASSNGATERYLKTSRQQFEWNDSTLEYT